MIINPYLFGSGLDPDAQAFITAAAITDPTQQAAINTLVVDLKGYSIWTKMKALYPMVGGTSSTHSYNLKNPAQYQITWNGGQTHDANGYTPGVNGYGNTGFATNLFTSANNFGLSTYLRTNTTSGADIGVFAPDLRYIGANLANFAYFGVGNTFISNANTDAKAFWQVNRTSASLVKGFKNSSVFVSGTTGAGTLGARTVFIGALNDNGSANFYAGRQHAFDAIHDGLTDTEAANYYTAVQAFQTTLGRSIGTQTVSDADAQAFVTAANIVDQVEADAINNLVIGMKADGLWTKMKAIYPFVGGTASTHKYNLKDSRDLDAAYRLVFNGGWTHSSTGAAPNGTNAYANTYLNPTSAYAVDNNVHLSYYSRTNVNTTQIEIGSAVATSGSYLMLEIRTTGTTYYIMNRTTAFATALDSDSRAFYIGSRIGTSEKGFKNNSNVVSITNTALTRPNYNFYLGALNAANIASSYSSKETAFASIGDGLTDTDAANLNTRVTTFQTALNRNV